MWIQKIRRGVLQLETDTGLRIVKPSFGQRLQLLWTFRNFNMLPEDVLSAHERQLVDRLSQKSCPVRQGDGASMPGPIIGILELGRPRFSGKKAPQRVLTTRRSSA